MSQYMLNDEDAINDINPFVMRDFSLPGGVRQTGNFDNFSELAGEQETFGLEADKSVYCDYGLCADSTSECSLSKPIQPQYNIERDYAELVETMFPSEEIPLEMETEFRRSALIQSFIIALILAVIIYYLRR